MEQQLYNVALLFAAVLNLMMAVALVHNNLWYPDYDVYRRSRLLSALVYVAFAVGFLLHWLFQWRTSCPVAASALTVGYFHIGAVLFGWSHTSLLRPDYLTRRIVIRDLSILALSIAAYAAPFLSPLGGKSCILPQGGLEGAAFLVFFAHASYIAFYFYRTYYSVRRSLSLRTADAKAPRWWTAEAKHEVLTRHHSFLLACHLIILFGLGSIVVTALFPIAVWPYTLLLALGILVFAYIFYSLEEYGHIIESATSATEDAAETIAGHIY
jgi:hypothetical protein